MWRRGVAAAILATGGIYGVLEEPHRRLRGEGSFYYKRFFHVYDARLFLLEKEGSERSEMSEFELELEYSREIKGIIISLFRGTYDEGEKKSRQCIGQESYS